MDGIAMAIDTIAMDIANIIFVSCKLLNRF